MEGDRISRRLALQARIDYFDARLEGLGRALGGMELWQPAGRLIGVIEEGRSELRSLRERIDRKLTLALVGPTGAGKSTLLNALAGGMEVSAVGSDRPTTRETTVYCRRAEDAEGLVDGIGREGTRVVERADGEGLDHLILVDTPDTDSIEGGGDTELHTRLAGQADVLLCVFHGQHPKRRDSTDFLGRLARTFHGSAILVAINQCDRLAEPELDAVVTDFKSHLDGGWGKEGIQFFVTSARRHLASPDWGADSGPLHQRDEFPQLRETILESLNQAEALSETRERRAEEITRWIEGYVDQEVRDLRPALIDVRGEIQGLFEEAMRDVVSHLQRDEGKVLVGVDLLFYDQLIQRWTPPMSWLLTIWSKFLALGSGLVGLSRMGNPLAQAAGAVSSAVQGLRTRQALSKFGTPEQGEAILERIRSRIGASWQDLANRLEDIGFHPGIREIDTVCPTREETQNQLLEAWRQCLNEAIERRATVCSHWGIQCALNLPIIALWGWMTLEVMVRFFAGDYVSADYARHAVLMIFLPWGVSFVLYQFFLTWFKGNGLLKQAIQRFLQQITQRREQYFGSPMIREIDTLIHLGSRTPPSH